jgi:RNA polymerase sigma-70 factor (ECF subfamily)
MSTTTSTAARPSGDELEALRNRDPEAVERWVYSQRDYLLRALRRYTSDADTARDLLQETFLQALRSLPSFRGDAKVSTWLYSIARNVALARHRKSKRYSHVDDDVLLGQMATENAGNLQTAEPEMPDPANDTMRSEEHRLLHEALDELSDSYRQIVRMRDLEEMSTEEVANELGLTRVNVRVRLHRARKQLRDALEPRFDASYQMAA